MRCMGFGRSKNGARAETSSCNAKDREDWVAEDRSKTFEWIQKHADNGQDCVSIDGSLLQPGRRILEITVQ